MRLLYLNEEVTPFLRIIAEETALLVLLCDGKVGSAVCIWSALEIVKIAVAEKFAFYVKKNKLQYCFLKYCIRIDAEPNYFRIFAKIKDFL